MTVLTIIVLSYNTSELTTTCINSVLTHTKDLDYEIIVVDNGSTDGSVEALQKLAASAKASSSQAKLQIIDNKKNVGFAAGNNLAAKKAKGKYLLLLNSDTKVESNVIAESVAFMESDGEVGVYSCGLKNKDGSTQPTGGYFPTLGRIAAWMLFIDDLPIISGLFSPYHPKPSFYKGAHEIDWVTGAYLMTRREIWDELGGLDTSYFMYVEDVDYCYKAKKLGWNVYFDGKNSIVHYGGSSSKGSYPVVSEFIGLKTFYRKHFKPKDRKLLHIILKLGAGVRIPIFGKNYVEAYSVA